MKSYNPVAPIMESMVQLTLWILTVKRTIYASSFNYATNIDISSQFVFEIVTIKFQISYNDILHQDGTVLSSGLFTFSDKGL